MVIIRVCNLGFYHFLSMFEKRWSLFSLKLSVSLYIYLFIRVFKHSLLVSCLLIFVVLQNSLLIKMQNSEKLFFTPKKISWHSFLLFLEFIYCNSDSSHHNPLKLMLKLRAFQLFSLLNDLMVTFWENPNQTMNHNNMSTLWCCSLRCCGCWSCGGVWN